MTASILTHSGYKAGLFTSPYIYRFNERIQIDGAQIPDEDVIRLTAKVRAFAGTVLFTRDTHETAYLDTQEGRNLPVPHCIRGTHGWEICDALLPYVKGDVIDKVTFGSSELGGLLKAMNETDPIRSVTLIGLCTDICVISNAMIVKAFLPEVPEIGRAHV